MESALYYFCGPSEEENGTCSVNKDLRRQSMTLPTFLGLGAMKSGTSWLHVQLESHPEVYVPYQRKEIHYFDELFHNGSEWYAKFFPAPDELHKYRAWGEITPEYLLVPEVPGRIHDLVPDCKFIVFLRNPADRLFSHYVMALTLGWTQKSLWEFADERKEAFRKGLYADQLKRYFELFDRDQFLILIYEHIFSNADNTRQALSQVGFFLDIDPTAFSLEKATTRVHERSGPPRFMAAYAAAFRLKRWLFQHDMDWVFRAAKGVGLSKKIFGESGELPRFSEEDRAKMLERYKPSIAELEELLGSDFSFWRGPKQSHPASAAKEMV